MRMFMGTGMLASSVAVWWAELRRRAETADQGSRCVRQRPPWSWFVSFSATSRCLNVGLQWFECGDSTGRSQRVAVAALCPPWSLFVRFHASVVEGPEPLVGPSATAGIWRTQRWLHLGQKPTAQSASTRPSVVGSVRAWAASLALKAWWNTSKPSRCGSPKRARSPTHSSCA